MRTNRSLTLKAAFLLWSICVGTGLWKLWAYEFTAGKALPPHTSWPADSALSYSRTSPTLVVAVHPKCPCTRATFYELGLIIAKCPKRVEIDVLRYRPSRPNEDWLGTKRQDLMAAIPGIRIKDDPDSREALKFGAVTSGEVLLYDERGQLLFKGGITASRGHIGDNMGQRILMEILQGTRSAARTTPVFGCALYGGEYASRN